MDREDVWTKEKKIIQISIKPNGTSKFFANHVMKKMHNSNLESRRGCPDDFGYNDWVGP